MTGRAFIRFIRHRGIPLSCLAERIDCKLSTLQNIQAQDEVPDYYISRFISEYDASLTEEEVKALSE